VSPSRHPPGGGGGRHKSHLPPPPPPELVPPVPKIRVRLFYAVCALLEKDELIAKLGGEATKNLALETMRANVSNFFNGRFTFSAKDKNQINTFHKQVG
jgi:hypothetical protein